MAPTGRTFDRPALSTPTPEAEIGGLLDESCCVVVVGQASGIRVRSELMVLSEVLYLLLSSTRPDLPLDYA